MTPQEQQMIDGLINRIRSTDVQNKDTQAEQYIQQGLGSDPEALYVLTQTVLVQQYGLQQAQSQLNELKQQNQLLQGQVQQAASQPQSSGGSFLSHIFGGGSSSAPAPSSTPQPGYQPVNNPGYGTQAYPPPPTPPPASYPSQGGGMFGGGGGFLQGALQTAAGVAAGEAVFQGMEDLFHGFGGGHHAGYGFGGGSGGETIVNNYYDDNNSADRDSGDRGRDDSIFYNPSDDASRSDLSGGGGNDLGFTDSTQDANFDDATDTDSGFGSDSSDDSSSMDDNS